MSALFDTVSLVLSVYVAPRRNSVCILRMNEADNYNTIRGEDTGCYENTKKKLESILNLIIKI